MAGKRLEPAETDEYKKRKTIANLAGVKKLAGYGDLNLIEAFAERFSLHPDDVYTDTSFDTIILFNEKWKNQAEYQERYQNIERMMNESKTTIPE